LFLLKGYGASFDLTLPRDNEFGYSVVASSAKRAWLGLIG